MKKVIGVWLLSGSVALVQAAEESGKAQAQSMPFPVQPNYWTNQMNQGMSAKDWYNYNAKAWNDWFGKGRTRYKFYGNMDLQMQMEWLARMNAANQARQTARQQGQYGYQGYAAPYSAYPYPPAPSMPEQAR